MKKRIIAICIFSVITVIILTYILFQRIDYGHNFSNSYYTDLKTTCKTAMIIVPHQDDEINLAGAVIKNLVENNCRVVVVFSTNGDCVFPGEKRIREGINSCKSLGVKQENVIFLGYGDVWKRGSYSHIYHATDNKPMMSHAGYWKTYGISEHPDYATKKYGYPFSYTRNNFLRNLTDVILDYLPDQIFCVDFDAHSEHRALSLFFEEALCKILKKTNNYFPEVYKGFAYSTGWSAADDFYRLNMCSTKKPDIDNLQNKRYETDVPQYNWKDRVRFPVAKDMLTHSLYGNPIFKALLENKSQLAFANARLIINSDEVFWNRSTRSVTYKSDISASSGITSYLNDFKLFDCCEITKRLNAEYCHYLWSPDANDTKKEVTVKFKTPQNICKVSLYDNFDIKSNILAGVITFSDNSKAKVDALHPNGSKTDICFPVKKGITSFSFKILADEGSAPGLCEIEVFAPDNKKQEHLIKLLDRENDMFIYRYFVAKGIKELALGVYQYPDYQDYSIRIVNQPESRAHISNGRIIFDDGFKYCKVRVELKNNSRVFDEVEFVQLNVWDIFAYNIWSFAAYNCDRLFVKVRSALTL